jgi:transcriptional regulator with XRE-family HTH domain
MKLIERLEAIRKAEEMAVDEFAVALGVSRNLWIDTRSGKYPVRFELLAGAVQRFGETYPDLEKLVIEYLKTAPRRKELARAAQLVAVGA